MEDLKTSVYGEEDPFDQKIVVFKIDDKGKGQKKEMNVIFTNYFIKTNYLTIYYSLPSLEI